jgi:signal transduction histidine kinase
LKNHSVSSSTGLGLYLVKEFLIPKLNGKINVENTNKGSQFTLTLKYY